jgi:hypothetical protein
MEVLEFRSKIKPGVSIVVDGIKYFVKEVVKFRFDDGSFYIKCFLNDGYVFADDLNDNSFLLVKEVKTTFQQPFLEKLAFDGRELNFLYTAHAVAEEVQGEEIFKKGDSERFWDYKAADGNYLSLGINDETNEKLDFYGMVINGSNIDLKM